MRKKVLGNQTGGPGFKVCEDEGPNHPLYPPKLRTCGRCGISTHNYFHCYRCQVQMKGRCPDAFYASEIMDQHSNSLANGQLGNGRKNMGFHSG